MMIDYVPHPYQLRAYEHAYNNPHCGLFLDMGLGKTVITLTLIGDLILSGNIKHVLVIAPLRVANSVWKQEAKKWKDTSWMRIAVCTGTEKQRTKALLSDSHVFVINRENTGWLFDTFLKRNVFRFNMLVIDELSSFKNQATQRFRALRKWRGHFKRIIGLTGTPAPNGYLDLWAQLFLLDGGNRLGRYITYYRQRYFIEKRVGGSEFALGYELKPGADKAIRQQISDICISMQTEDYLQLPELIVNDVEVEMTHEQMKAYKQFERDKIIEISSQILTAANGTSLSGKLLQWSNGATYYDLDGKYVETHRNKLDAFLELVEEAGDNPVLCAYMYKHDLYRIVRELRNKYPEKRLALLKDDGDVENWNAGEIDILLAHPASAGHGLNLQYGGNVIIWFGLTFSLELYQQFTKRLRRQGAIKPVIMYRILCKGTYDYHVREVLDGKRDTQKSLMDYLKVKLYEYHTQK